jgi:lipopolysaccharide biosynthesis protein
VRTEIAAIGRRVPDAPLVFVNAWNEWAEGAILEPDLKYGYAWLHAIRRALLPDVTRQRRPCAVIHVWYVELLEELLQALAATGLVFRVVCTVPREREEAVRRELTRLGREAEIVTVANHGRDILPFLSLIGRLHDEGEDVVLKLHTKRSTHRADGAAWRADLVDRLASPARAAAIVTAFAADPALGLVAPEGHVQPLGYYWGANATNTEYLCSLLGIPQPDAETDRFVAGSMFWCRLGALAPLFDAPLSAGDFNPEAGQVDGTMAHAVERVVTLVVAQGGFDMTTAAELIGEDPPPEGPYAYARRH